MKTRFTKSALIIAAAALLALAGCSQQDDPTAPPPGGFTKNGSETLGTPSIAIASGSGIAQGGVGLVTQPGTLTIDVPGDVVQTLLYWSGGTNVAPYFGDDTIVVDGTEVTGELIGGPSFFFEGIYFTAYRADITSLGLVASGANSLEISGMDYEAGSFNENDGASILVIYDDGTSAAIELRDGLDLAFFNFPGDRQVTVPQTFTFPAAAEMVTADLVVMSGSVGTNRPNEVRVTIDGDVQSFTDALGSFDGALWDVVTLPVGIPAGATELTVELISTDSIDPLGASLSWVASALSVPIIEIEPASLGDRVWNDLNMDGIQDDGEPGVEGVVVHLLDCLGNTLAEDVTDADGLYLFEGLMPGEYNVHFVLPDGWMWSPQDAGADDVDSDADLNGFTICTDLEAGENDLTWDAGIYEEPVQEGCTLTIGFWKTHAGFGPQDDVLTPLLPIWLGDDDGAKSLPVTDAEIAVDVLEMKTYGRNNNGITKLYAQLLGAKLNIASGADDGDVADAIADADAFLADHDWNDWGDLGDEDQDQVMAWQGMFDDYNNGLIGPGHCDDDDDDDMDKLAPIRGM